jgi:hypothetical protein
VKVFVVMANQNYQGATIDSVHESEDAAERRAREIAYVEEQEVIPE